MLNHVTTLKDLPVILYYLYTCFRTVLTTCKTGSKVEVHREEQTDRMFRKLHCSEDLFELWTSASSFFYYCHRMKVTQLFTSNLMSLYHQDREKMRTRVQLVPCKYLHQEPTNLCSIVLYQLWNKLWEHMMTTTSDLFKLGKHFSFLTWNKLIEENLLNKETDFLSFFHRFRQVHGIIWILFKTECYRDSFGLLYRQDTYPTSVWGLRGEKINQK